MDLKLTAEFFAFIVHKINNRVCELNGEQQIAWDDTPDYMRNGLIEALKRDDSPREGHEAWMKNRLENGWTLGPVKNIELKTSPCLVPYEELPYAQRVKDSIRIGVRDAMRELLQEG